MKVTVEDASYICKLKDLVPGDFAIIIDDKISEFKGEVIKIFDGVQTALDYVNTYAVSLSSNNILPNASESGLKVQKIMPGQKIIISL